MSGTRWPCPFEEGTRRSVPGSGTACHAVLPVHGCREPVDTSPVGMSPFSVIGWFEIFATAGLIGTRAG